MSSGNRIVRGAAVVGLPVSAPLRAPELASADARWVRKFAMVRFLCLLVLALSHVPPAAAAQTKNQTIEGAHAFLGEVLAKGTSFFAATNDKGMFRGTEYRIDVYKGADCSSRFSATVNGANKLRSIEWSHVTQVDRESDAFVTVKGRILVADGSVVTWAWFRLESDALAERVRTAFEFLRKQCDKSSQHGF